jgi:hypothetical protein
LQPRCFQRTCFQRTLLCCLCLPLLAFAAASVGRLRTLPASVIASPAHAASSAQYGEYLVASLDSLW